MPITVLSGCVQVIMLFFIAVLWKCSFRFMFQTAHVLLVCYLQNCSSSTVDVRIGDLLGWAILWRHGGSISTNRKVEAMGLCRILSLVFFSRLVCGHDIDPCVFFLTGLWA